jgi:hypothetical protein
MFRRNVLSPSSGSKSNPRKQARKQAAGSVFVTYYSLLVFCSVYSPILKMEALRSSETSITLYLTAWCHISEHRTLHSQCRESLESQTGRRWWAGRNFQGGFSIHLETEENHVNISGNQAEVWIWNLSNEILGCRRYTNMLSMYVFWRYQIWITAETLTNMNDGFLFPHSPQHIAWIIGHAFELAKIISPPSVLTIFVTCLWLRD